MIVLVHSPTPLWRSIVRCSTLTSPDGVGWAKSFVGCAEEPSGVEDTVYIFLVKIRPYYTPLVGPHLLIANRLEWRSSSCVLTTITRASDQRHFRPCERKAVLKGSPCSHSCLLAVLSTTINDQLWYYNDRNLSRYSSRCRFRSSSGTYGAPHTTNDGRASMPTYSNIAWVM